jgi:CheY-like chemotaxis protein
VLVAEDEDGARKTIAAMLRRLGFEPLCASNGEEALRLLEREPDACLLITDMMMPLMGGMALAETAAKQRPQIGILLISGYTAEPPETTGCQGKTPLFLPKPLAFGALARKLRELLNV